MSQAEVIRSAARLKIYRPIRFCEFDPQMEGEVKVHINPTRARYEAFAQSEEQDKNLVFAGELLDLTPDEARQLFLTEKEEDQVFLSWLLNKVLDLVKEHQQRDFLASKT